MSLHFPSFFIGKNSTGASETKHWQDMITKPRQAVVQWHRLKPEWWNGRATISKAKWQRRRRRKRKKQHTQIMTLIISPCTLLLPPPLFLFFFVTSTTSSKESYDLFCWSKWLRSRSKTEMTERKNEYWKREARRYWTIFCSYDKMVGRFCLIGLELFDWKGFIHGNWKRKKDWQYCHVLYGRLFFFWSSRTCRSRKDIPYSLIPT